MIPGRPRSFFGGPLEGDRPLRFIYLDEAGTSANEPVSVVVGIIVNADTQWGPASNALNEVIETVPDKYRENFISHATAIWGSQKYRDVWSYEDRLKFLNTIMSIPRRLRIPIAFGLVRRDSFVPEPKPGQKPITREQFHHVLAFINTVARADNYIRDYGAPDEVATLVAEDVPEMRMLLRASMGFLKGDYRFSIEHIQATKDELASGILRQKRDVFSRRIVDTVHFCEKGSAFSTDSGRMRIWREEIFF
jgi:hypothetical protein